MRTREDRLLVCVLVALVLLFAYLYVTTAGTAQYRYTHTCQPGYYEH